MRLILASTSPYRRALLERLCVAFETARPNVDEAPLAGESPALLARRLAQGKAEAVVRDARDAWVIGSDQVAALDGTALGKPGDHASAVAQLQAMSGRVVVFHTAVCLCHGDVRDIHVDVTTVDMRRLANDEIERYVTVEQPFDCAGSFKAELLGISLFEAIRSQDPTALVGLPLIATARMLRAAGWRLP